MIIAKEKELETIGLQAAAAAHSWNSIINNNCNCKRAKKRN